MSERTGIEWTSATWNPWRGCDKVSPGCAHCYMFTEQRRYGQDPSVVTRCSDATFYAPVRANKWRQLPAGAHVFTCSWSDFFHEDADAWRGDAWEVIRQRPDLTWQILTKRPERIREHLPVGWGDGWPNVWLGVSIENRRYVHRADVLRAVPAAVRFISAEPLLGPLVPRRGCYCFADVERTNSPWPGGYDGPALSLESIDWLIAGGESGPCHRPMRPEWVRNLRDVCAHAGVAFFLKQLGGPSGAKRGGDSAVLDGRRHTAMPGRPA